MSNSNTNKLRGIFFMILASSAFATMNLFAKLTNGVNPYQKTFISNLVATIIVSIIIIKRKESFIGKKENRKFLLVRGVMGTIAIITNYASLQYLILPNATILSKLAPFFTIIFSFIILKEKITKVQIGILLAAFAGSLFVVKPSFNASVIPSLIAILSACVSGVAYTMIRRIGTNENFWTVILSFTGIATIVTSFSIFFDNTNLVGINLLFLVLSGVSFTLGQVFLTLAYRNAPASEISVYDFFGLVLAAVYGFVFLKEMPDATSWMGYCIIVLVSITNISYSKRLNNKIRKNQVTK
ncbi:MAG: DMT family transporter [Sarcina sp.]